MNLIQPLISLTLTLFCSREINWGRRWHRNSSTYEKHKIFEYLLILFLFSVLVHSNCSEFTTKLIIFSSQFLGFHFMAVNKAAKYSPQVLVSLSLSPGTGAAAQ